jgi:hypothetical protein
MSLAISYRENKEGRWRNQSRYIPEGRMLKYEFSRGEALRSAQMIHDERHKLPQLPIIVSLHIMRYIRRKVLIAMKT